ncbi:MAG: aldo/keto reductase [Pseudomonadota bacterium]
MDYTQLGRTGIRASVAGLGCGGRSRLGLDFGRDHAIKVVHRALDLGVTLFDTAAHYGTEEALGAALRGKRRDVVLISKAKPPIHPRPIRALGGARLGGLTPMISGRKLRRSLEGSLRALQTDYLDVFLIHRVFPEDYERVRDEAMPVLQRFQEEGKIRAYGVTESFKDDLDHVALSRVLADGVAPIIMAGFNILHQTARHGILDRAGAAGVGVLGMYAVRQALRNLEALRPALAEMSARGEMASNDVGLDTLLGALDTCAEEIELPDIAYRYARHEPGIDIVLTGTGDLAHLERNVASILSPPLPDPALVEINRLFGRNRRICGDDGTSH